MDGVKSLGQRLFRRWLAVAGIVLLAACAGMAPQPETPPVAYTLEGGEGFRAYAPVVVPQAYAAPYNRVGQPRARLDERGQERVYVDPETPVFFVDQQHFSTEDASYTNFLYRLHFSEVPFSLAPFHLTVGNNGGLFLIVTVDAQQRPVLFTTVHTCGCYLAFVPTNFLPADAIPPNWPQRDQRVFGETLPRMLTFQEPFEPSQRVLVRLRHGTHRIMDVEVIDAAHLARTHTVIPAAAQPREALLGIPRDGGGTTSFFYEQGWRRGYVRDAFKPLEFVLMSWWTLDPLVGSDKRLGDPQETGTVFYTSLRPWYRDESNLWNFPRFLEFWGWNL